MPTRILPFTALCAVIALPCAAQSLSPQDKLPALPDGKVWKLVWNDEFDGTRIDETKWERQEYQRRDGWWDRRASALDGEGHLLVYCFREGDRYLDGSLRTKGKFEHTYGYYVCRAQLQREVGHWSAFWLMGDGVGKIGDEGRDGTEVDIFEKPSLDNVVCHALHWDGYGEHHKSASAKAEVPGVMDGYHDFALWWSPEEYVFYVDGKETWRTGAGGVCRAPLFIKLTDEVGKWAGDIARAELPDAFIVDYVRVYDVVAAP